MPTHNFRELLKAMPVARQQRIERRFQKSLAAMPLDQLRKAQQMTQLRLAEVLGINQGAPDAVAIDFGEPHGAVRSRCDPALS
jgi:hypothetical protein